jgi:putative addiction module component (TIGR02574 family)
MRSTPDLPPPGFDELSAEEKLDYIQALWDRFAARPEEVPIPDWQRRILRERLAAHRRGEGETRPWTEVREELQALLRDARR